MAEWLFYPTPDDTLPDISFFVIVRKDFWEKNHYADDREISRALSRDFPDFPGFECMESTFEFEASYEEATAILEDLGLSLIEDWPFS